MSAFQIVATIRNNQKTVTRYHTDNNAVGSVDGEISGQMAFTCGGASYAAQRMYMLLYPRTGGVKGEKKLLKASSPALR